MTNPTAQKKSFNENKHLLAHRFVGSSEFALVENDPKFHVIKCQKGGFSTLLVTSDEQDAIDCFNSAVKLCEGLE